MQTQIAGLTVTFSLSTLKYTLSAAGAFSVTWTSTAGTVMRDLLGFESNLSGFSSYTSTKRPKYLVVARLNGQSQVHETYEPGGRISYADVCIWSLLREGSAEDVELVTKAAAGCKTLQCIADGVAALPAVSEWVKSRPVTSF